jgi:hypothetical protein
MKFWPVVGLALSAAGVLIAPRDLVRPWDPGRSAPLTPMSVKQSDGRRWLRVTTPAELTLEETVNRYRISARSYVCRRSCDDPSLPMDQCRGLRGSFWLAAGEPPPTERPPCVERP